MSKQLLTPILDEILNNTLDLALKRRAKNIILALDPQPGEKILDVGCGDGFYLHVLSNLKVKLALVGTDFDKAALLSCRKNLNNKKVKLVQADLMSKLPFKANTFDKIVMSEVLEHLPDDKRGLLEVKRVLKKGGTLCLSVPCANYPFLWDPINWILEKILDTHFKSGFLAGIWNQHIRLYSKKGLTRVIEKSGLRIVEIKPVTFWSLPFNHYIINLGARYLARNASISKKIIGANKFAVSRKRSKYIQLFSHISNIVDKLNDIPLPNDAGVSYFAVVKK